MIFSLKQINTKNLSVIQGLSSIKPIPQLTAWENTAREFYRKGHIKEAAILFDIASNHYTTDAVCAASERVLHIPASMKGRGMTHYLHQQDHPAIHLLRRKTRPIIAGKFIWMTSPDYCYLFSPDIPKPFDIHFPVTSIIGFGNDFIWTDGSRSLYFSTLEQIDLSSADYHHIYQMPIAKLDFPTEIQRLCGPLSDGTFFVTCKPDIPVFSDVCRLCHLDRDKICTFLKDHPNQICEISKIGGVLKNTIMPNVEQTLLGDTEAMDTCFMTCGGGMQNREVRFIFGDGSWKAKVQHEAPVIGILQSEFGPVSIDKDGVAFLWKDQRIVDDKLFPLSSLPDPFHEDLEHSDITIDWRHGLLYLTHTSEKTSPGVDTLDTVIKNSHSCCLSEKEFDTHSFVKKIYTFDTVSIAMLADGNLYYWDMENQCVDFRWQLPKPMANGNDWKELLSNEESPSLEDDPRIRILNDTNVADYSHQP